MEMKPQYVVNFTNRMVQSANAPVVILWRLFGAVQFHQQKYALFY
jgi:hypothetical protein